MTNHAYIDYIRLASWDDSESLRMFGQVRKLSSHWRNARWLQYKGHRSSHYFYGAGEQTGKRHYVFEGSGPFSVELFNIALDFPSIYCTRIDVQVTIDHPNDYDPHETYLLQKQISKRQCSIVQSDSGSTIYFGSRSGDTFARLYEKTIDESQFLRLEFEIKGNKARSAYLQMKEGTNASDVFLHYLNKVKMPDYVKEWYSVPESGIVYWELERIHHADKQLEWLSSLGNTIVRMGNDHYQGTMVRALLDDWQKRIDINKE